MSKFRKPGIPEPEAGGVGVMEPGTTASIATDSLPSVQDNTIWGYMRKLTPDQWTSHGWYLWRTDPTGEFARGQPRFREKGSQPIDEAYVEAKYGGYKWLLQLNIYDRKGNAKELYKERFNIESKPKVQPGERLIESDAPVAGQSAIAPAAPAPDNGPLYAMLNRLIDRLDNQKPAEPKQSPIEAASEKAMTGALDLQAKGLTGVIEMMKATVVEAMGSRKDPLENIEGVAKLIKSLTPAQPATATTDPIAQFTTMFDFVEKIKGKGEGASPAAGKYAWVEAASNGLAQILSTPVGQQLGTFLLMKAASIGVPDAKAPAGPAGPQLVGKPVAPVNGAATAPQPAQAQEEASGVVTVDQYEASKKWMMKETFVKMFSRGDSGSQIAQWIEDADESFALVLCDTMKRAVMNPAVLDDWKADSVLKKLFEFPMQRLIEFGTQYVAYFDEEDDDELPNPAQPGA